VKNAAASGESPPKTVKFFLYDLVSKATKATAYHGCDVKGSGFGILCHAQSHSKATPKPLQSHCLSSFQRQKHFSIEILRGLIRGPSSIEINMPQINSICIKPQGYPLAHPKG
jgi:hypothetical protein